MRRFVPMMAVPVAVAVVMLTALVATPGGQGAEARLLHVSPAGSGAVCSSAQPCTLAVAMHNLDDLPSVIMLPAGTVVGTLVITEQDTDGAPLTIEGASESTSVLSGGFSGAPTVVVDAGVTVTLENLEVTAGQGTREQEGAGGIDNAGTLTLDDVDVTGNSVVNSIDGAGGIVNIATMTLDGSTVSANTGSNNDACAGGIANDGTMTLSDTLVSDNDCNVGFQFGVGGIIDGGFGLAESNTTTAADTLTIEGGSTIAGNVTSDCGNDCSVGAGGILAGGPVSLSDSTVSGNTADAYGGGLWSDDSSDTVSDSLFSGNTAGSGGGAIDVPQGGAVSVSDSTFYDNSAGTNGGAIDNADGSSGTATVIASTFDVDHADGGGEDIASSLDGGDGSLTWAADIFQGSCALVGGVTDDGYNASMDDTCEDGGQGDVTSVENSDFAAPAANGGPTDTIALEPGSSIIGLIPSGSRADNISLCPTVDQRGYASETSMCDPGAYQTTGVPVQPGGGGGVGVTGTAPVFTQDSPPTTATVGVSYTYAFVATGLPTAITYSLEDAPSFLTIDPTTGVVSGTPTSTGTFSYTVTASNGVLPNAITSLFTVTVSAAGAGGSGSGGSGSGGGGSGSGGTPPAPGSCPSTATMHPGSEVAIAAVTVGGCPGYLVTDSAGLVTAYGAAVLHGDLTDQPRVAPIVGIAATPDGGGYYLVSSVGGVYTFGDAVFQGAQAGQPLNAPVVGMAVTPDGGGYWLVAADGGVFRFGDATFLGSEGGTTLNAPVVGMAAGADGGYYLVAADGGLFTFDVPFHGSMGGTPLNRPIVGMTATPAGGYRLVAADGGVFDFDAPFFGPITLPVLSQPVVGMAETADTDGYWLLDGAGQIHNYGDAGYLGGA
jgi:hypothetical protein